MKKVKFPPAFFITGTDTGIGKTFVSAVLTIGLQAKYWKPIQSGLEPYTDSQWIQEKTALPDKHFSPETYKFKQPLSPHLAARLEDTHIDVQRIKLPDSHPCSHLIVEGAGGTMVPITESFFVIDLIKHLDLPALVVARSTLGTINHSLLTIEKLRQKGITILGVVMNGPQNDHNRQAIEDYGQVPVLAQIEQTNKIDADNLSRLFNHHFKDNIN